MLLYGSIVFLCSQIINMKRLIFSFLIIGIAFTSKSQEHSVARQWTEVTLDGIRGDNARPTVHARNLWHLSLGMYDIWAVFDEVAEPYLLGNEVNGIQVVFEEFPFPDNIEESREEAISHFAYNFLRYRYRFSPSYFTFLGVLNDKMEELGYNSFNISTDYTTGDPAALGNYMSEQLIDFALQDGSNEVFNYTNQFYQPVNPPLFVDNPGNPNIIDLNRWQPLTLDVFIDQSGNEIPGNTPPFLGPEWGQVEPFGLTMNDANVYNRDDFDYIVYHDPGPPPLVDSLGNNEEYLWGFELVLAWGAHLDSNDETLWDISPGASGNKDELPTTFQEYKDYYNLMDGGDGSTGHDVNPHTGEPYEPNIVKRGDYARVLAEFWADGPDSETPPGHWFTILNYVMDQPEFERKYQGTHLIEEDLEYDVKAYFMLGGAMHDCAISAWGIKGWYDYLRPISAIRAMAENGQSTDPNLDNYSPLGAPLKEGFIEIVEDEDDPLAGSAGQHLGKIKVYTWRGPDYIFDPEINTANVGWILLENWWPYQRPTFVTPNFAGYISGHSTYSRAAAEILTALTGDAFFPGGVGEFEAPINEFLVFEEGPSETITLEWATYRDASNQTSLSRIWGGIHPPADDIPGRKIGIKIAEDVFFKANEYYYNDVDGDGYYNFEDCDDNNPLMNPGLSEDCDDFDNDCNGLVNDGLPQNRFYLDTDEDGFGELEMSIDTCFVTPPIGYVDNSDDCNDFDDRIFPNQTETCDAIDNDCDGNVNNGLQRYIYFMDEDNDGFGNEDMMIDTCISNPPAGFVENSLDCDDKANKTFPGAQDVADNGIDEDCSGFDFFEETQFFPTFLQSDNELRVQYNFQGEVQLQLLTSDGRLLRNNAIDIENNFFTLNIEDVPVGIYFIRFYNKEKDFNEVAKLIKVL